MELSAGGKIWHPWKWWSFPGTHSWYPQRWAHQWLWCLGMSPALLLPGNQTSVGLTFIGLHCLQLHWSNDCSPLEARGHFDIDQFDADTVGSSSMKMSTGKPLLAKPHIHSASHVVGILLAGCSKGGLPPTAKKDHGWLICCILSWLWCDSGGGTAAP